MPIAIDLAEILANQPGCLPDFADYQYYKNLMERRLILNAGIDDDLLELIILPYMEMDNDGTGEPIEIILNSGGGEIYSGFNLVDQIERAKTPTTIHIMSMAASMGTLIAMAGKNNPNVKTVCHPFSVGLLHGGSQYMEGSAHAVKDLFNFTEQYENKIKDFILTHSNITEDYYEKIERKELWLDADEMLRLGVVDEIIK